VYWLPDRYSHGRILFAGIVLAPLQQSAAAE
jgi:hypothetical protein